MKFIAAARAAASAGRSLSLVADEIGCPTYAPDLAAGIMDLIADPASAGLHHVVNAGEASRATWARSVLAAAAIDVATEDVSIDSWPRASTPPRWAVLEPTPLPTLGRLRAWRSALSEYLERRLVESAGETA
jgi:dTDP-4-dehydrorhamnose reductase